MTHTPGPWKPQRSMTCGHLRAAHNFPCAPKAEWTDADIALIAAAPKLLAVLQPFASLLQSHHDGKLDSTPVFEINGKQITVGQLRAARAAILAATGDGQALEGK
mgnify:CR=1 FL=1